MRHHRPSRLATLLAVACLGGASGATIHAQGTFPVRPSADARVLVDASGMALLSPADLDVLLDDSVGRGFTALELALIGHDPRGRHVPFDDRGAAPFLRRLDGQPWQGALKYGNAAAEAPDFTTPNEARHNLVWMLGGDFGEFDARQAEVERALIDGLMQGAPGTPVKLRSAEWSSETIGTDHPEFGSLITLNGAYTFDGYAADHARRAYWWGWLGSIGGYVAGNGYVWPFAGDTWRAHLDSRGARDLAHLNAFVRSVAWHTLVPSGLDGMPDLIVPPDGAGSFDVDLRALRGSLRARWFDPTTSGYRAIAAALPNAAPHTFRLPGRNAAGERDWVLVLDTAPAGR